MSARPVRLAARNDQGKKQPYLKSRLWVDGSISDDMPAKRLTRIYGVNHFIVSQVNPHVFPFVTDTLRVSDLWSILNNASSRPVGPPPTTTTLLDAMAWPFNTSS